jgi:Phage derived protein Gp49-like (DUF891)
VAARPGPPLCFTGEPARAGDNSLVRVALLGPFEVQDDAGGCLLVPGTRLRILFVFDPWRSAILLVAGDKAGSWNKWYVRMIPRAEQLYEVYLKERAPEEEGSQ